MMLLLTIILNLTIGFFLGKSNVKSLSKTLVWLLPVSNLLIAYFFLMPSTAWARMTILISLLFLGMKAVSAVYRYPDRSRLFFLQWVCFSLGWPGMDPTPFEQLGKRKLVYYAKFFKSGFIYFLSGILLLYLLAYSLKFFYIPVYLLCLFSFIPFIMIFHLGIFNIGAGVWSCFGVNVVPLMDDPWKAKSLSEFWGKRWNIAFIQMTRITVFMPLAKRTNSNFALIISFIISGIFHEVALTLPVYSNYGMPLAYFLLQAILVLLEKKCMTGQRILIQKTWTILCLLLPFPLLFHPVFVKDVFLPLLHGLV